MDAVHQMNAEHGPKIVTAAISLGLIGVTGTAGMLWGVQSRLDTLAVKQDTASTVSTLSARRVNDKFSQVWKTNDNQAKRLNRHRKTINQNQRAISVLQTRVQNLED